jgi:hypothetical protein
MEKYGPEKGDSATIGPPSSLVLRQQGSRLDVTIVKGEYHLDPIG